MTPKDECILQETAGRIMCGIGKHGVIEKDWNNPGNWMVKQTDSGDTEFTKFDFGFCEFRDPEADMAPMWVVNNGRAPIRMGMGSLLLNSQDRIKKKLEQIDVKTVSFVGSFTKPAFNLKSDQYRGETADDGKTYTLKLGTGLKPGKYKLKVVLNGDSALSYGVAGRMDVEDELVKFMVKAGGQPVFSFNTETDEITVTDSDGEALTCDNGVKQCSPS